MSLSAAHEVFIEQFMELRNVRDAAVAAGFDASYGYRLFKKLRTQIEERLQDEMVMMQAEAVHVVKETMTKGDYDPKTQSVKLRAAETAMDRGTMTKKQNLEVGVKDMPAVMILPAKDPDVPSRTVNEEDLED